MRVLHTNFRCVVNTLYFILKHMLKHPSICCHYFRFLISLSSVHHSQLFYAPQYPHAKFATNSSQSRIFFKSASLRLRNRKKKSGKTGFNNWLLRNFAKITGPKSIKTDDETLCRGEQEYEYLSTCGRDIAKNDKRTGF